MIRTILRDVLKAPERFDWRLALHLPYDKSNWTLDSKAILEDPDDVDSDDPDALPESVTEEGCVYVLSMQDVKGVVVNANLQVARPSDDVLFDALMYYLKNDAFIIL